MRQRHHFTLIQFWLEFTDTHSSSLSAAGHLPVLRDQLVTSEAGEGPRGSRLGHRSGLAAGALLRLPAAHLGRLLPGHHSGDPVGGREGERVADHD